MTSIEESQHLRTGLECGVPLLCLADEPDRRPGIFAAAGRPEIFNGSECVTMVTYAKNLRQEIMKKGETYK